MKNFGCISTIEFEKAAQSVGELPYSEIKARVRRHASVAIDELLALENKVAGDFITPKATPQV